jgi:MMP 1-O-methyltransferase
MLQKMNEELKRLAAETKGFMPEDEGLALYAAAQEVAGRGPLLEIGSYCGKSSIYLGAAAQEADSTLFTIDHHRGSEEHQRGEEYHDDQLFDENLRRIDTLPELLDTLARAGLTKNVVALVGRSEELAASWTVPLALVFIDGGHSRAAAHTDLDGWTPHVMPGGLLAIHDVFEEPSEGGRPPYEIFERALNSGAFTEHSRTDSLRVLQKV